MIFINMVTPQEMMQKIAAATRAKRLSHNWSQQTLSERSGISYGTLKKFERTGRISLESLLMIAITLEAIQGFEDLFAPDPPEKALSLDMIIKDTVKKTRKRGRK